RTTIGEAGKGRHEKATRGEKLLRSGLSRAATTGVAEENPGAMSRFTRRAYFSLTGDQYSQRRPAFTVKPGFTRRSSLTKASWIAERRYLSELPKAIELVSGTPSRNPAKSWPAAAPVKANVPRASC